jgi:hypothetical protein
MQNLLGNSGISTPGYGFQSDGHSNKFMAINQKKGAAIIYGRPIASAMAGFYA